MAAVSSSGPEVKGMGRTWIARGPSYWTRRVAAAGLALVLTVLAGAITVALGLAIVRSVPVVWAVLATVLIVVVVGYSFVRGYLALVRAEGVPVRSTRSRRGRTLAGAGGSGLGLLALAGSAVSSALLVFSAPFCVGWAAAWFLACLRHDYPGEAEARRRLRD